MTSVEILKTLSFDQFAEKYHNDIRLAISWGRLNDATTGIKIIDNHDQRIHLLHCDEKVGGCWLGEFRNVRTGNNDIIFRGPALKYGQEFLLLDGNHRIQFYKPRIVVLDWIEVDYYSLFNHIDCGLKFVEQCRRV